MAAAPIVSDLVRDIATDGGRLQLVAGRVRFSGPARALTPERRAAVKAHRVTLAAHLLGLATGHALAPCSECGAESIVNVHRRAPACRMTFRCPGRHVVHEADKADRRGTPAAPKETAPPARVRKARFLERQVAA
jgi:hypothetical protein